MAKKFSFKESRKMTSGLSGMTGAVIMGLGGVGLGAALAMLVAPSEDIQPPRPNLLETPELEAPKLVEEESRIDDVAEPDAKSVGAADHEAPKLVEITEDATLNEAPSEEVVDVDPAAAGNEPQSSDAATAAPTNETTAKDDAQEPTPETAPQDSAAMEAPIAEETATIEEDAQEEEPSFETMRLTFKSGDTLSGLLEEADLVKGEARAIIAELNKYTAPNKYRVDQYFDLEIIPEEENRRLQRLTFEKTSLETVVIERDGDVLTSSLDEVPTLTERRLLVVPVEVSIWQVTGINGVPASVRAKMLNILSYGLDLQREVQPNDRFEIIYDATVTEEGDVVAGGAIQYVALIQKNRAKRYFRFDDPSYGIDYYDEQGRSSKKLLMKTPIDGARLSSHYGMRKHPILGYSKMHTGTDFAAPTGTKIYAAGSGKVVKAGWLGGYGNYIRIKHRSGYETAYAHMVRFAKGIRTGVSVSQGQVIGYVGSTGRSTGPHLHYEVLVNGKHVNPMGLNLPSGRDLEKKSLPAFKQMVAMVDEALPGEADKAYLAKLEIKQPKAPAKVISKETPPTPMRRPKG